MRWRWSGALVVLAGVALACGARSSVPPAAAPALSLSAPTPEDAMDHPWIDVARRKIRVRGLELAVFDSGGEGTPILFVHGLGSTSAFWQKQLTGGRLDGHRLLAVDLPGWGDSSQPDGPYTPSWYAEHLVGLLDALGVDQAHVVGHSMGGQASLALALDYPQRIRSLTLSAPAGIERFSEQEGALIRGFWTDERLRGRTEETARASYGFVFARWDDDVERLLQARMAVDGTDRFDGLVRAVQRSVAGMLAEPVFDRLDQLAVPTLYVYGPADRMIPATALHPDQTPASIAALAAATIPNLTVVELAGAGHTPHHDAPQAFDSALNTHIRTLESP